MGGTAADVVVVGAGVMGCATAYFLAASGARVTVVEQHRVGGSPSASGASAAIVEALAGNPGPLARQAQLARRLLATLAPQLLDRTGIDIEFTRVGSIYLAFSEREMIGLRAQLPGLFAEQGEATEWLDTAPLRGLEPASPRGLRGGLYVPGTNGLYAPKYVRALAAGAAAHGATILQGVAVTGFERHGERVTAVRTSEGDLAAGQVVLATGAWTGIASRWLDVRLPIVPQRGQIMALAPAPGGPTVSHVLHGSGGYVVPKTNGTACVGATHEAVGFDARVTTSGIKFLADLALRIAPGLESAALKHAWMGFRPVLESGGMPPVGRLPGFTNAYVASGHGAIGVTVSAAVGYLLAQLLRGEAPEQSLAPFDPAQVVGEE